MKITTSQIPQEAGQAIANEVHRLTGVDIDADEATWIAAAMLNAWPDTKMLCYFARGKSVVGIVLPIKAEGDES